MRGLVTVLAATFAVASPAAATASTIHTIAGNGSLTPLGDGGPATAAALGAATDIEATADGGFLLIDGARVRRVGPDARITTVAGTGKPGFTGDGGPATAARIYPSGIGVAPDGGFLIAECQNNRVRRVAPDGVITTVAGKGPLARGGSPAFHFGGDNGPATSGQLACPVDVAVQADGGFLIADRENYRIRRVGPDGVITTFAGSAKNDDYRRPSGDGGPATRAHFEPSRLALASDGSLLIADSFFSEVRRVGTDGIITTVAGTGEEGGTPREGALATSVAISPRAIAATADGGFLVGNTADRSCVGTTPSVLKILDGRVHPVAGSGRFELDPPQGDERRGDGGPADLSDLRSVEGVAPAPDGGAFVVDSQVECSDARVPALVRYVAPDAPTVFAANFVTAQNRFFTPGDPHSVDVSLTLPGTVTIAVTSGGQSNEAQPVPLAAGSNSVELPMPLGGKPATVTLTAVDASGVERRDRMDVFPRNWLTSARASIDAAKLADAVPRLADGFSGISPILSCKRFGAGRVDCRMSENRRRCDGVISVSLRAGALFWGEYRCPFRKRPRWRQRPARLKRTDAACTDIDTWCDGHRLALPFGWGADSFIAYKGLI